MLVGRRPETMLKVILSGRWKGALLLWMSRPKKGHKKRMLDDWRKCAGGAMKLLLVAVRSEKKFGKPTAFQ